MAIRTACNVSDHGGMRMDATIKPKLKTQYPYSTWGSMAIRLHDLQCRCIRYASIFSFRDVNDNDIPGPYCSRLFSTMDGLCPSSYYG